MGGFQPEPASCFDDCCLNMQMRNGAPNAACRYLMRMYNVFQKMGPMAVPLAHFGEPPNCKGVTFPHLYMHGVACDDMLECMVGFQRMELHSVVYISLEYSHAVS